MKKSLNLPINHSVYLVFYLGQQGWCEWFDDKKEAKLWRESKSPFMKRYSKPVKFTRDY